MSEQSLSVRELLRIQRARDAEIATLTAEREQVRELVEAVLESQAAVDCKLIEAVEALNESVFTVSSDYGDEYTAVDGELLLHANTLAANQLKEQQDETD